MQIYHRTINATVYAYGMLVGGLKSHHMQALLQPSTSTVSILILIILIFLVFHHPSIEAALVGPASFTQVQVARHDDYSLVTTLSLRPAPTPLSCCIS